MKERILRSVINVFALLTSYRTDNNLYIIRNLVEIYLSTKFSKPTQQNYLQLFADRHAFYYDQKKKSPQEEDQFFLEEVEAECYIINRELPVSDKLNFFIYLLEFYPFFKHAVTDNDQKNESTTSIFESISGHLSIKTSTFKDCFSFISDDFSRISEKNRLLIYSDQEGLVIREVMCEYSPSVKGVAIFLELIEENVVLFKVKGNSRFEINNQLIYKSRIYFLNEGETIIVDNNYSVYYNDIIKKFRANRNLVPVNLVVNKVEYVYKKSTNGIKPLSLVAKSGQLIAIMGTSGAGKTTLLNIFNGNIRPDSGSVTINGINVHQKLDQVKGIIGYVPQDDSLIEELTVYQNLYLMAKLSLGNSSDHELRSLVERNLNDFELWDIKDLKIGKPNEKVISGGQRKRLNIALELIRNPLVLFLDEPLSGLSSFDSDKVMLLLKKLTLEGRIVIVNIHQPTSYIYKLFDKLLFIDQKGYPIYYGDALKALPYFKSAFNLVDSHIFECLSCGNVNPEEMFHVIQKPPTLNSVRDQKLRSKTPEKWYKYYLRKQDNVDTSPIKEPTKLPDSKLSIPDKLQQFLTYTYRDILIKKGNVQSAALTVGIGPLLAFILAGFCKQYDIESQEYIYTSNENIPIFLLMSVIVALFIGLINSAEEILKDKKLLKREAFIGLSKTAYILAKMKVQFTLSFIQMLSYVWVGNSVLQIEEMTWPFFLILWSTACFSNLLGLFISTIFQTRAAVYITIPFLLIPQILLAGAVLEYDNLNKWFKTNKNVPAIGNSMVSRWAYEAMVVKLFKDNQFEKNFYELDVDINHYSYIQNFYIPKIQELLYTDRSIFKTAEDSAKLHQAFLHSRAKLSSLLKLDKKFRLNSSVNILDMEEFILAARTQTALLLDSLRLARDQKTEEMGDSTYYNQYTHYYNKQLANLVFCDDMTAKTLYSNGKFIRRFRPIYDMPENRYGLAHFYAPFKLIGNWKIPTPIFNMGIIWLFSISLFLFTRIKLTNI